MAELTIHVNGKPYSVGCDDGEEARLRSLGALIDERVRGLETGGAQLGETRLMLLGALVIADELTAAKAALATARGDAERLREALDRADTRAVAALEAAAQKIETMASR